MVSRDDEYLESRLEYLINTYFSDIDFSNELYIQFGKRSRRQLGSIKMERKKNILGFIYQDKSSPSIITITSIFKKEIVPEVIIDSTIAHELVHYAHGFNSPLQQKYKHPHKGNVVKKELIKRGYGEKLLFSEKWLKDNWKIVVNS